MQVTHYARYKMGNIVRFHLYEVWRIIKFTETESRIGVTRGCREEEMRICWEDRENKVGNKLWILGS